MVYNLPDYAPPERSKRVSFWGFLFSGDGKRDWSAIPPFCVPGTRGKVCSGRTSRSPEETAPELTLN